MRDTDKVFELGTLLDADVLSVYDESSYAFAVSGQKSTVGAIACSLPFSTSCSHGQPVVHNVIHLFQAHRVGSEQLELLAIGCVDGLWLGELGCELVFRCNHPTVCSHAMHRSFTPCRKSKNGDTMRIHGRHPYLRCHR